MVLEQWVLVHADSVPLGVWTPDPELVLDPTTHDPVVVVQPGLLPGPCLGQDTGQLGGAPLGDVWDAKLAVGGFLLEMDSCLGLEDILLQAGEEVRVQCLEVRSAVWHHRNLEDLVPGQRLI